VTELNGCAQLFGDPSFPRVMATQAEVVALCARLGDVERGALIREGCEEGYAMHSALQQSGQVTIEQFAQWWLAESAATLLIEQVSERALTCARYAIHVRCVFSLTARGLCPDSSLASSKPRLAQPLRCEGVPRAYPFDTGYSPLNHSSNPGVKRLTGARETLGAAARAA
jgi:hypothetical protein